MEPTVYEWVVLQDYPGSPFQVGEKVQAYDSGIISGLKYHGDGYGPYYEKICMAEYPHLFKRV